MDNKAPQKKQVGFLAIDQYGQKYNIEKHPRKELLEYLGRTKASKMYVDLETGISQHIGYIISGLWLTIYSIYNWK